VNTTTHQYAIEGEATNKEGQTVGGLYFQDAWRATSHLTLNYGLRWELTGAVHNSNGLWTGPTLTDLYGPSTGLFQPGTLSSDLNPQIYLRTHPYGNDFNEPAPNFGFAWNPTFDHGVLQSITGGDKVVIRGGFSLSRYDEGWVPVESTTLFGNPGATQAEFLPAGTSPLATNAGVLGTPLTLQTSPASFTFPQPESEFFESGLPLSTVNPNIRPPYVEAWNFGIQRKLPGDTILDVAYVGNHAVHMWMMYDLNETNIFENGFLKQFQTAQTNLKLNGNTTFADNTGVPGLIPTPIFDAAFGGAGAAVGASNQLSSFTNPTYITYLQQGQAGALANQLATAAGGAFLCNMVGNSFAPCAAMGLGAGHYPQNFFQLNPNAAGSYAALLSDPGSSSYNGLQVQVKHQTHHGLMFNANYTWSHAFTNRYLGDYYTADSAQVNFVTLHNPGLNRGPGPYDLRNVFKTFLTYELPFGPGHAWTTSSHALNKVIGGWTVGSVVGAQTGRNFKLQSGYNTFNYSNAPWPDASDSGVVLTGISRSQLQKDVGKYANPIPGTSEPLVFLPPSLLSSSGTANPTYFTEPGSGQLGQFVWLTGPTLFTADMSVIKSIPITERVKLNFYAEFLNVFNHPAWFVLDNYSFQSVNNPADYANINSTTFSGLYESTGSGVGGSLTPRNIQFRLQLAF